jgi:uncharacterized phage protein (TIGR02220 family)
MWKEIKPNLNIKADRVCVYTPCSDPAMTFRVLPSSAIHKITTATHYVELPAPSECAGDIDLVLGALTERLRAHNARLKGYKNNKSNAKHLKQRLSEGHTIAECLYVVNIKCAEWMGTEYQKFLRPQTLFNSEKFPGYLNQVVHEEKTFAERSREKQGTFMNGGEVIEGVIYEQRRIT